MSRDRDRILEDALKHELRAARPEGATGDACLDAETLAAFEDGGLTAAAMESVELHLSGCPRCQAMVAASARGLSGHQATGQSAEAASPTESAGGWAFWKWMAPLAAGAAAVTVWMVIPQQREIAEAPPQPAATPRVTESVAAPAPAETAANAPILPDTSALDASRAEVKAETVEARQQDAPAEREREARKARATADTAITLQQASPVVPAPAPAALPPPAAAAPPPPPAVASESAAVAGLQRRAEFSFAPLQIVSPSAAQRWRVTAIGIELSTDGGVNWSLVRAAAGETITAGASPSPSVCWLIGHDGAVLLTTNGTVFTRVDIPGAGNLRSITATSGSSATVTDAAGRTFRTDDSGRTWR